METPYNTSDKPVHLHILNSRSPVSVNTGEQTLRDCLNLSHRLDLICCKGDFLAKTAGTGIGNDEILLISHTAPVAPFLYLG